MEKKEMMRTTRIFAFASMKPKRIFSTIFLPFFLSSLLAILLMSSLYSVIFQKMAMDIINRNAIASLDSISLNISKAKEIVTALSIQAYYDNAIFPLLYYEYVPSTETIKNSQRLVSLKNTFPYIHSLYAFNGHFYYASVSASINVPTITSEDSFFDREIVALLQTIENYKKNSIIPRYVDNYSAEGTLLGKSLVYTYVFYDYYNATGKVDNALVFNLSEKWFKENMDIYTSDESSLMIINRSGILLNNTDGYSALEDIGALEHIQRIIGSDAAQGVFAATVGDVDSVITYKTIYPDEWILVSIQKSSDINQQIFRFTNAIIGISIAIMLTAFIIVFLISRQMSISVNSMAFDIKKFRVHKRRNQYAERQQVLEYIYLNDGVEAKERLDELKIAVNDNDRYRLVLLKIDNYRLFCDSYTLQDRKTIKFGLANIIKEDMGTHFPGECLDTGDDGMLLILTGKEIMSGAAVEEFLTTIREHIEQFVRLSCTCIISGDPCTLDQIRNTYTSLLTLSYFRILSGKGTNIHANTVMRQPMEGFVYPGESVSSLTQGIVSGNEQEAHEEIHKILLYAAPYGATVLNSCISSLLITLNDVFGSIKRSNLLALDYSFDLYIEQIQSLETLDEVENFFKDRFSAIISDIMKNKSSKHEKLVNQVVAYIHDNYQSPDLGLGAIADFAGISPSYLSKLFKQYMPGSLNEYIGNVRMEKARNLLQQTSLSVNEVMKRTGFISRSHFYTMFKSAYGVTPVEMKKAVREQ